MTTNSTLWEFISPYIDASYPLHSRIHPLHAFPKGAHWFVKRDDELSCGISGSKYRKYASLLPYLKKERFQNIHLVGSSYSNHLVGILQLLNENSLTPIVYVLDATSKPVKGNYALIKWLLGEKTLHILSKEEWLQRDAIIQEKLDDVSFYVPEGADCLPALYGALSLAADIGYQEKKLGITFDHIFIDAGTGLSAIALILGASFLRLQAHIHVTLMAGSEKEFENKLHHYKSLLPMDISLCSYELHKSLLSASFGSTSKKVFEEVRWMALNEGILCDPIYSVKLFHTAKLVQQNHHLEGNLLCIHSGGTLSLLGFPEALY